MPQKYELCVINATGERLMVRFPSEGKLVQFLRSTRQTHAPISFAYGDGSSLDNTAMERIHKRLFAK